MNSADTNLASRRKRKFSSCRECNGPDDDNMVQCDACDIWSHYQCVGVGPEIKDMYWACRRCLDSYKEAKANEVKINYVRGSTKPKQTPKKPKKAVCSGGEPEDKTNETNITNVRGLTKEDYQPWQQLFKEMQDLRSSFQNLVVQCELSKLERADQLKVSERYEGAESSSESTIEYLQREQIVERVVDEQIVERVVDERIVERVVDEQIVERVVDKQIVERGIDEQIVERVVESSEIAEPLQIGELAESIGPGRGETLELAEFVELPIDEKRQIVAFQEALKNKDFALKKVESYQGFFAETYRKMVVIVTQQIFTDNFLQGYNLCGQRGKLPLNTYGNVVTLVVDATHKKFPDISKAQILNYFKDHIKHAKERFDAKNKS